MKRRFEGPHAAYPDRRAQVAVTADCGARAGDRRCRIRGSMLLRFWRIDDAAGILVGCGYPDVARWLSAVMDGVWTTVQAGDHALPGSGSR